MSGLANVCIASETHAEKHLSMNGFGISPAELEAFPDKELSKLSMAPFAPYENQVHICNF
jgi:hypothetical protein